MCILLDMCWEACGSLGLLVYSVPKQAKNRRNGDLDKIKQKIVELGKDGSKEGESPEVEQAQIDNDQVREDNGAGNANVTDNQDQHMTKE